MSRLLALYLLLASGFAVYTYGFLDFNLTLSAHPTFLAVTRVLQQLVYYDRPHSALVYCLFMLALFGCYVLLIRRVSKGGGMRFPWRAYGVILLLATLSYPLLSYDIFNYMFHGKILWVYHQNPHLHAPLEYSSDLWLRFMRWVHTPSAYGPAFTAVESLAYLLGLGKFVPVLYLMKLTMVSFFGGSVYLIGAIARELGWAKRRVVGAQMLIAWNPFLLLECGFNAHNDAVMIFFLLLSIYLLLCARRPASVLALAVSIGVKYVTALALPMYFIRNTKYKVIVVVLALYLPILASPGRFQPWYLVWPLLPATLLSVPGRIRWLLLTSIAGASYYVPYIATGFWNNSLPFVSLLLYGPLLVSLGTHLVRAKSKPSL
jgi:hypothetical protein